MNIEMTDLDMILNYLETTNLEPHDDYTSEITYKDQKILYKYIKELQQEKQELKNLIDIILNFSFFKEECPLNLGFEKDTNEDKAQDVFNENEYCENICNNNFKKCWLKYFERLRELERGVSNAKD